MPDNQPSSTVIFVCLHGSAKSLIAAEHFNRLALERGFGARAESLGIEPDERAPVPVVEGLASDGFDVSGYRPRMATAERLGRASFIVSFGCELGATPPSATVEQWSDMPMVSDGFAPARDAIVTRVKELLDSLT
jgi:protein-tyrosine-phosphatase